MQVGSCCWDILKHKGPASALRYINAGGVLLSECTSTDESPAALLGCTNVDPQPVTKGKASH